MTEYHADPSASRADGSNGRGVIPCASCGDLLASGDPIYYGNIGTEYVFAVCAACAAWESHATFVRGVVDEAAYIIRQRQKEKAA
jgi:hypothetical protein